mmetsp:Transcript_73176/g.136756  ORF Transcript_73176/g.136756 Transcript_73176/m.136756 type:complete len:184 (-) Transcript_73176:45-596(-)
MSLFGFLHTEQQQPSREPVIRTWTANTEICGKEQPIHFLGETPTVDSFKEAVAGRLSLPTCSLDVMDLTCRGRSVFDDEEFWGLMESGAVFRISVVAVPPGSREETDFERLATPFPSETLEMASAPASPMKNQGALAERYTALSNAQSDLHLKHQTLQAEVQRLRSEIASMAHELATIAAENR